MVWQVNSCQHVTKLMSVGSKPRRVVAHHDSKGNQAVQRHTLVLGLNPPRANQAPSLSCAAWRSPLEILTRFELFDPRKTPLALSESARTHVPVL